MVARRVAVALLLLAWIFGPQMQTSARAQSGTTWSFDSGLGGWTVSGLWAADNTPTSGVNGPAIAPATSPPTPPVGPPPGISSGAAYSPPNSLNYNDATNGTYSTATSGTATSPSITISSAENFGWRCAYETENSSEAYSYSPSAPATAGDWMTYYDRRIVRVRQGSPTGPIVYEAAMVPVGGNNPPITTVSPPYTLAVYHNCSQMGEWHTHYFQLDPAWSPMFVQFVFDSIDTSVNDHTGWFIDDAAVGASSGGGGPGGSGPGGAARPNANGDESGNDLFGENWCGSASSTVGSSLGLLAVFAILAMLLVDRR